MYIYFFCCFLCCWCEKIQPPTFLATQSLPFFALKRRVEFTYSIGIIDIYLLYQLFFLYDKSVSDEHTHILENVSLSLVAVVVVSISSKVVHKSYIYIYIIHIYGGVSVSVLLVVHARLDLIYYE